MKQIKYEQRPIRVLHIVTTMNRGGLETMLMNYYRHVDRTKVQFDFLVHRAFEADYDSEILSLGGKIYHVSRLNPFNPSYYKELDDFFKNHKKYKVVHVHQDCLSSIALKVAKKNHVPMRIAHSHNANQDRNIKFLIKKHYMKSIPKFATELFACGKHAGDWMFRGEKYIVLKNAIDKDNFKYNLDVRNRIRKELKLQKNIVLGHVGRFNPQKNHEYLIDIFHKVHRLNIHTKLMLIGSGDLEEKIKEKVLTLGLKDDVLFLGNRSDVNELLQAMDVFVFPSHYEGLPVTLVEAQAAGLPIVKSTSISEQCSITPNVTSLPLNSDCTIWAQKILDICNSFERKDTSTYIVDNGYDISSNAKWLEGFYLEEVKKYE